MNVTLNLITEFDDIPRELAHILKFVEEELDLASKNANFTAAKLSDCPTCLVDTKEYSEEIMGLLHGVRLHMAKIDSRMEDCMSILGGYMHYLETPPEDEPQEEEQLQEEEQNEEG